MNRSFTTNLVHPGREQLDQLDANTWYIIARELTMCDITMVQSVRYSPSQERKLVVFERNCGATTGFTTHVSVLAADRELPNQQGNLFAMDGHPEWTQVTVTWIDEDHVLIRYPTGPTIYKANERFWWTQVTYEPRAR